jgi:hypothetical protein
MNFLVKVTAYLKGRGVWSKGKTEENLLWYHFLFPPQIMLPRIEPSTPG